MKGPQHHRLRQPGPAPRTVPAAGAPGAVADDVDVEVDFHGTEGAVSSIWRSTRSAALRPAGPRAASRAARLLS